MRGLRTVIAFVFAVSLLSCERDSGANVEVGGPRREATDLVCPVHGAAVAKMEGGGGVRCYASDTLRGLTFQEARQRFPYAVWDGNYYHRDETSDASMNFYYLVCEECNEAWKQLEPVPPAGRPSIQIVRNGGIVFDGEIVELGELPGRIREKERKPSGIRLRIHAEEGVESNRVREVVETCKASGIDEFVFGHRPERHSSEMGAEE